MMSAKVIIHYPLSNYQFGIMKELLKVPQSFTYPPLFGMMFGTGKNKLNICNVKSPSV